MSKILGIDYGKIMTGLSITDKNKIFAFGLKSILTKDLMFFLKSIIYNEKIEKLVIGLPKKLNNKIELLLEKKIKKFIKEFKKLYPSISISRIDERLTSKISIQYMILMKLKSKKKKKNRIKKGRVTTAMLNSILWDRNISKETKLHIVFYGNPILRKKCLDINFSNYKKKYIIRLIENMFETINKVKGIGLAAPQIGKNIKLFIVDTPLLLNKNNEDNYREIFINAKLLKIFGKEYKFNEGCLSFPGIYGYVKRKSNIIIEYHNQYGEKKIKYFTGIKARIILHEYDHIEGKLFIDYFSLKKRILIKKLFSKNIIKS
ncbi:peptide deformylase [Blattabacterium cuenoti]|uniref:peptide deformylase n=1 Tax=Blattabacterium cuenoti TaxID=1653831 RepID=UPI001EEBAB5E|nr:peptide deformylase [Blattabacterium cuenoti]